MFLFDVLHLLNEFHVFTSPIKTFISMGVIFILSEVLCWHVAWSVKCICLFQPSRNSIKTLRTSNETTKLWWNRYYIYFVNKNSNESDSTIYKMSINYNILNFMLNKKIMLNILIFFLITKHSLQMKFEVGRGIQLTCPPVSFDKL